ncbi:DUF3612 domain-containing protein, partial [Vibrio cholerae]|uniref:DUF3612 domain-containing protein n=1 Tax=Vibrio cholerae TaxID=666 RepID=UPI002016874A
PPAAHVQRLEFAEWAVRCAYSVCNHDYRAANNTLFLAAEYRANVVDPAGNNRVLCAGIDLNPAINAQGGDALAIAQELKMSCVQKGG